MSDTKNDINTKMEQAFHNGTISELSSEEREVFLKHLCTKSTSVITGVLDPREINRATLLSLFKHQDFIDKIEKSNRLMTLIAVGTSILALVVSLYSIYSTWDVADNIGRIATSTEELNKNAIKTIKSEVSELKAALPATVPNKAPQPTPKNGAAEL